MNKIDFAKINKKEDMIMAFNQLKDDYSNLFQQIQELTNNWNELEEYIKDLPNNEYVGYLKPDILDKMKEIQNGSDDNE